MSNRVTGQTGNQAATLSAIQTPHSGASSAGPSTGPSAVPDDSSWSLLGAQWARHLAAKNLSAKTQDNYTRTLVKFAAHAISQGVDDPEEVSEEMINDYMATMLKSTSARGRPMSSSSVATDYRHLRVFFNWLARSEDITSPMEHTSPPKLAERVPKVFSDDELRALIDACKGRGFTDRRDTAILRLLFDTGVRRGELIDMKIEDFNLAAQQITVIGKGDRERVVSYGAKTAEAIDSYMRARTKHRDRKLPQMWLADPSNHRGALLYHGLQLMLDRRSTAAGVANVHPHRFRHTAVHHFLESGGTEGEAMVLFGWTSRAMLERYGRSAAQDRALKSARRISAGDRI